jgi:hypothetical protein
MSDRWKGFLFSAVVVAGTAGYLTLQGVSWTELLIFIPIVALCMVIPSLGFWKRFAPPGRLRDAAITAEGGGLLVLVRDGGARDARRLRDGGEVALGALPLEPDDRDRLDLRAELTYPDNFARLWLTGELRRTLHGLQPGPKPALEFLRGDLISSGRLAAATAEPVPVLVLHRETLDPGGAELVSSIALRGGAVQWIARIAPPLVGDASHVFVFAGQIVIARVAEPAEAIALDAATGAIQWRVAL